jgi:dTDP-4-dehydrorhamnose 3,5-epimerase
MEKFKIEDTDIEGVKLIHPFFAPDERGYFMKTYEREVFRENGIDMGNAEDMTSYSKKGVLRGLHFQTKYSQDKLCRVYYGEVYDVAVDLRKGSPTFGKWKGFLLSGENRLGLYIPSGFAHGYLALSDEVIFSYRCGQPYAPDFDSGIIWNDKDLGVAWPTENIDQLIISSKDQKLQTFAEFKSHSEGFEGIGL